MASVTIKSKINDSITIIKEALLIHKNKIAVSCSFGKDSIVTTHLTLQLYKDIPVIVVLTKYKPEETINYMKKIRRLWNLNLEIYQSDVQINPFLYITNPDECCRILKVEPMKEALKNRNGWITGLRNTENVIRKNYQAIEKKGNIFKYNPILKWTELDVWKYIAINQIPTHPWYSLGYRSIGCEPCTKIVSDDEPERNGRWVGTSKCGGECGIHTKRLK